MTVRSRDPRGLQRLLLVLLLAAGVAGAPPTQAAERLRSAVNQRVGEARRVAREVGVHVVELASGNEVYSYNADRSLILASNTKLFTTAAALELLSPGYRFETPILIRGALYDGVLDGDLAVVGGGDPNISGRFFGGDVFAVFRSWAETLRLRGVRQVRGDLLLVDGLFEPGGVHADWPRDQLSRWYEAPVGALSFNDNCVLVRVAPGGSPGAPARVELEPDLGLLRLESSATTTSVARHQQIAVERDGHTIRARGAVYLRGAPYEVWVTVPDPTEYFGAALARVLWEEGITVAGKLRPVTRLPGGVWEQVDAHRSGILPTLAVINQRSQNFYAESLLKTLAARRVGEGSWEKGVDEVEAFLARASLNGGGLSLADGSGMSRNNRATPRHVTGLLRHMYFHPWGRQFLNSLPASGSEIPGWRRRLADGRYRGNVFAKTGTLSGVSALSGYAKASSGKLYAFSILLNRTGATWRARRAQDWIVRALIDHG